MPDFRSRLNLSAMTAATHAYRPLTPAVRRAAAFLFLVALGLAAVAVSASASASSHSRPVASGAAGNTIVRAHPGRERAAEALVARLGGTVRMRLQIINGFTASLPVRAAAILRHDSAVLSVTPNRAMKPQGSSYSAAYDPGSDGYSMSQITQLTGARAWWAAGYTGQGVGVALMDSGVAPVQGLSSPGQVVNGPDLSLESQAPNLRYLDTFGHGTFMAGLIAGRDAAPSPGAPPSTYLGMAPDAHIVSLKVGDADGGTDVVQVIAAIDWVVQHRNDNGLNIHVINLSYGTNSLQDPKIDPLAYAVEQAWRKGILVVAAAGNTGYQYSKGAPGLADPAYDPVDVAVAGSDTMGTLEVKDDVVASYSASACHGGVCKSPDLTAPGSHMQGLRVPNSFIDVNHPEGFLSGRYFRGSGTSEASAIVSGAAALMFQKFPTATPDAIKKLLVGATTSLSGADTFSQGTGELQLTKAINKPTSPWSQAPKAIGTGSLEGARGQDHLTRDGVVLQGEQDLFGSPINTKTLAASEAAGNSWSGGTWNGNSWSGNSWSGNSWSGNTWSGNSWSGNSWSSSNWTGNTWSGNTWSGSSWSGSSWSGSSWSGGSWAGAFWG
jgi:serine protease AprX